MATPHTTSTPLEDASAPPEFDRRRAWLFTAMIVAFMLINYADKSVLGLAAVPIMDELNISNSTYGLISSSFSILFSLSGLVVGFVSARVSSRALLFTMALLWAVAQLPVLIVAAVPTLIAGRVLLGAAEGPAASMSMHALYKWFPFDRRGLPSALQISGAALGTLVAAPVVTWLITAFGWRSAFAALAVTSVVWSAIWWKVGHDGPYGQARPRGSGAGAGPRQPPETRIAYRKLLLNGTVIGSIASAFGASWALAVSHAWLPAYLRTQLDMTPGGAATVISGISAFSLVLLLAVSPFADALRRRGVSSRWANGAPQGIAVLVAASAMASISFAGGGLAPTPAARRGVRGQRHRLSPALHDDGRRRAHPPARGALRHRRRDGDAARPRRPVSHGASARHRGLAERGLHRLVPALLRGHAPVRADRAAVHTSGAGRAAAGSRPR